MSATAGILHQDFKDDFVARMPKEGGTVPIAKIRAWLETKRASARFQERLAQYLPIPA